ncbi:hypothetical protein HPP92_019933 [Vanilla planifolia]|uniref:Uncharacterized protein n=1 Tax=Vanilla planifolia TaxID=51239 RepID=A0A835Q1G9_VANPL|nr:hypothetical protein HPP92_019933 [Vanilla planifolia]
MRLGNNDRKLDARRWTKDDSQKTEESGKLTVDREWPTVNGGCRTAGWRRYSADK